MSHQVVGGPLLVLVDCAAGDSLGVAPVRGRVAHPFGSLVGGGNEKTFT